MAPTSTSATLPATARPVTWSTPAARRHLARGRRRVRRRRRTRWQRRAHLDGLHWRQIAGAVFELFTEDLLHEGGDADLARLQRSAVEVLLELRADLAERGEAPAGVALEHAHDDGFEPRRKPRHML